MWLLCAKRLNQAQPCIHTNYRVITWVMKRTGTWPRKTDMKPPCGHEGIGTTCPLQNRMPKYMIEIEREKGKEEGKGKVRKKMMLIYDALIHPPYSLVWNLKSMPPPPGDSAPSKHWLKAGYATVLQCNDFSFLTGYKWWGAKFLWEKLWWGPESTGHQS